MGKSIDLAFRLQRTDVKFHAPRRLGDLRMSGRISSPTATSQSSAPPPPTPAVFAALVGLVGGVAAAGTDTEPARGTSEVPLVVARPIDAVRVNGCARGRLEGHTDRAVSASGCSVNPGQLDAVMRKSVTSPPEAIVTASFVAITRSPVPTLVIVTVAVAVAPTAVPGNIGPLAAHSAGSAPGQRPAMNAARSARCVVSSV